jgi:hypothetical protein
MNEKISTGFLIICAVALFLIGGALGVFYQSKMQSGRQSLQPECTATAVSAIKSLSSDLALSVLAYGKITNINNRIITLSYNGVLLPVNVGQGAVVYSFVTGPGGKKTQSQINFGDIKIGDNANVTMKFLPDGTLQAQAVMINSLKQK